MPSSWLDVWMDNQKQVDDLSINKHPMRDRDIECDRCGYEIPYGTDCFELDGTIYCSIRCASKSANEAGEE